MGGNENSSNINTAKDDIVWQNENRTIFGLQGLIFAQNSRVMKWQEYF